MALIRTGSNALVYYQGRSEPEVSDLLAKLLRPGMVFLDVGAHTGEYSLLAARAVGPTGRVHAFEPQAVLREAVARNLRLNGLEQVTIHPLAVADVAGEMRFAERHDPSVSSLTRDGSANSGREIVVQATTLDEQAEAIGGRIDLIKMDIEGAEPLAFRGARRLLELPMDRAPAWVFEYAPRNCRRLGLDAAAMLTGLTERGYRLYAVGEGGALSPVSPEELGERAGNLYASKRPAEHAGLQLA